MSRPYGLIAALACALVFFTTARAADLPTHHMQARIEPAAHQLKASDRIDFAAPRAATLVLSTRFRIDALSVDGRRVEPTVTLEGKFQRIILPAARSIELSWHGTLAALDRSMDHRDTLTYDEPASGEDGTFLPSGSAWYPTVDGSLERYEVQLDLPATQRGLVPGRLLEESVTQGRYRARFEFAHPAEGITLIAGPYRIDERRVRTVAGSEVRLRTYFHPEIESLASGYLDSIKSYLDLYEGWIGAYPFSEFSVVSSPTPTGFGMPTLTYLGIDVLRLPFIRFTSLGHEILHNWWGNGVYPDYAHGNWSEGLTAFMADYTYRERKGPEAARAARLAWLRDFAAMPRAEDMPLVRFTSRTHGASQIVGYNKAAMLFFMLRDLIGKDAFNRGVREFWREYRFRIASWDDLRGAFEHASGKKLGTFFSQWLERTGAPTLHIANASAERSAGGWKLAVTLTQDAPAYTLSVPLAVRTDHGEITRRVELTREKETAVIKLNAQPLSIALDPELRLMRRLGPSEAPPILRDLMLAQRPGLVVPSADTAVQAAAQTLAARLLEGSATRRSKASNVLVIGLHADTDAWLAKEGLAPRPAKLAATRGSAQVWTLRTHDGRVFAVVSVKDAQSLTALVRPLPHYGRESYLVFDGSRALERGTWPTQPQVWNLAAPESASRN